MSEVVWAGVPTGMTALAIQQAVAEGATQVLYIGSDEAGLENIAAGLCCFAPDLSVTTVPAWDCLPYDRVSPAAAVIAERLGALVKLKAGQARVVLTSVSAVLQRLPPPAWLEQESFTLAKGISLNLVALQNFFVTGGYVRAQTVREPGEFAIRGGLVDLFPAGFSQPVRLDLFGETIESLRSFDPISQRSEGPVESVSLLPVSEYPLDAEAVARFRQRYRENFGAAGPDDLLYTAVSEGRRHAGLEHWLPLFHSTPLATLFDYLPDASLMCGAETGSAITARLAQIADFYQARLQQKAVDKKNSAPPYNPLPPEALYLDMADWERATLSRPTIQLTPFTPPETRDLGGRRGRTFADVRAKDGVNLMAAVASNLLTETRRVLIAGHTEGSRDRLAAMLAEHGASRLETIVLPLEHGFETAELVIVAEADIFGERLSRPSKKRKRADNFLREVSSLAENDLVVHVAHGLGRYTGLENVAVGGAAHDCLKVVYADGDRLFIPVENMDVLSRYGSDDPGAVLDKLGGQGWQNRKARVKRKLRDMAEALLKIAAERALRRAEEITPPEGLYQEFIARFPYAETEDQQNAISDVLDDLNSGRPMDRLICGDVGFGKTEVALRAAFVAAMAGLQVAVITPTTLLSRQHFRNFSARFSGLPLRLGQLSRLVAGKESNAIKAELAAGQMDIVVGTHALLGANIKFHNLGLVIVDEEQHFGVKQKERLKQLRHEVHVLTLTATPIPRTLQLALAGVREMSLITTPPIDRLAVRTFVLPFDPVIIKEALMREHFRGGQSFYVTPRIEDLPRLTEQLRELVPDLKFAVAHGQMPPTELENVISDFYAGKFDILLSTNIVESGLDIPNANTIFIHRADMFGLAQLYQLRGRVGRGKLRGYAYLTYPADRQLNQTAQKRLEVMTTLDSLGAGFTLASHDMDIRGGGNLLGEEQSGHIREVGAELYQQMLQDAVNEARLGKKAAASRDESWQPQINLGLPVLIPESYVNDLGLRLSLYRRISELEDQAAIDAFGAELVDRFGKMPPEVENLLSTVAIKQLCRTINIEKCDAGPKGAILAFRGNQHPNPAGLVAWLAAQGGAIKLRPDHKLVALRPWDDPAKRLTGLNKILVELAKLAT